MYINVSTQFIISYGDVFDGNRHTYIGLNIETDCVCVCVFVCRVFKGMYGRRQGMYGGVGGRLCMGLTGNVGGGGLSGNACKGGLKNVGVRGEQDKVMMGGSLRWVAGIVSGEGIDE